MADSARIKLLETLITMANGLRSLDDGFELLSRRLNMALRQLQSAKTYLSVSSDFDSLLHTTREALERVLKQKPTEMILSEFDGINSRLLNHIVSFINDQKKKIELLSNIFRDDQVESKRRYEIELRERESLRKIILHSKLAGLNLADKKALQTLNAQFKTVIKRYVDRCISVHGIIQVRGLEQISGDFRRKFYGQTSSTNTQIKAPLIATVNISLESTHVHFRPDKSTAFERREARDAMTLGSIHSKGYDETLWKKLAVAPYMPTLMERDRFVNEQTENQSLSPASILQKHRWIVMLGDPGSGKTTFVRWLALKFAQTLKREENIVKLPTIAENSTKTEAITVGSARIPILIRVGEYGDALHENNTLSLFDYIGRHQWIGQTFVNIASITERNRAITQLSNALKSYVQAGQALIILDGLDEIPASEQRHRIVDRIESFVEQFVQTPSCVSAFDQERFGFSRHHFSQLDLPVNSGGNQIVVTSRIVGYHVGPLKGNFAHFTLEPLKLSGIYLFVDYWFEAVHRELLRMLRISSQNNKTIKSKIQDQTGKLKAEITNTNNKGLRELASNPLLLSVICIMSSQSRGLTNNALPVHRVCLYQDAVEWMLSSWHSRGSRISMDGVKSVLCKLATYIHENSASGLIEQSTMIRICSESLIATTNETGESRVADFVRIIRDEVGVLAARGEFAYGFLHLTFQEYFVALHMLDVGSISSTEKAESIASQFFKHLSDPRYREPLLLSLGLISWKFSAGEYDSFCCELLSKRSYQNKIFTSLMPLGAMLFVTSIGDLVKLPSNTLVFYAFDQILNASAEHQWHQFFPDLEKLISNGLSKLTPVVAVKWVIWFLNSTSISITQISAFCNVLIATHAQTASSSLGSVSWLDHQIIDLLWNHLSFEHEDKELIIDSALIQLVQAFPSWFDSPRLRFRAFAISKNLVIPPSLLSLVITLYGGLWRDANNKVQFSVKHIHRDSSLTPLLIRYFHPKNENSRETNFSHLIDYCNRVVESLIFNDHSLRAVDSFLTLFCLKSMKDYEYFQPYTEYKAFQLAQQRMKRVFRTLCHFYFSYENCSSPASTDGTEIFAELARINDFENTNYPVNSSAMNKMIENMSAVADAVRRLTSSGNSFLFPGQKSEVSAIALPPLFFNTKLVQSMLLTENNGAGLPKFLRKFWFLSLDPGPYEDVTFKRCADIDCFSCAMALGHDTTPLFALTFTSELVQNLYLRLIARGECVLGNKCASDDKELLHEVHLLTECLMELHGHSHCKYTVAYLLFLLHPLLKKVRLENLAASFIWRLKSRMLKKHYYSLIDVTLDDEVNICQTIAEEQVNDVYGEAELENEDTVILNAISLEMVRLQENLARSCPDDQLLYSSSVSLIHMCWFVAETRSQLLAATAQAVHLISSPISRLHALSIIISHPCVTQIIHKPFLENQTLHDDFHSSLKVLSLISSPMIASLLVIRCISHVDANETRSQLISLILKKFHELTLSSPEDAQLIGEILSTYSSPSLDPLFVQQQQQQKNIREMKSPILFDHIYSPVSSSYTPSQQTTLAACHLTELAYDVQTIMSKQSVISSSEYVSDNIRVLTASTAIDITRQIQSTTRDLHKIDDQLHLFEQVSSAGSQIIQQWFFYKEEELKILAYHAALLLAYSNIWSITVMNVLCDLLLNKIDRYRQRAEFILRSELLPWQSSQLGLDVFLTLMERYSLFRTTSPYACLIIAWSFEKIEIDDIDHLVELITREKRRIEIVLENTKNGNKNMQSIPYYTEFINYVSTPVLCRLCQTIENETNYIMKMEAEDSSSEVQIQFIEHLLCVSSVYSRMAVPQEKIFHETCAKILKNDMINMRIRQAVVFALGCCSKDSLSLLETEMLKSISPTFRSTAILSYCRCLSNYYNHMTEVEKIAARSSLESVIQFLFDSPDEVCQAAADGLARIYALWDDGLDLILKCLRDDHIRAYFAMLNATKERYVSNDEQTRIQRAAEFIEQHSASLLSLFIHDLFQSIEHFQSSIHIRQNIVGFIGDRQTVQIAAVLVQKMPAAFCAEVNRSDFGEKLKRALFYTSKQNDFTRRAACVAVLSSFGNLTSEMCDMFIAALLDSPWSQATAYECVSRILYVSDSHVVATLFSYMSSESLIARYTIAKLLVRLHQQGVIAVTEVQTVLSASIKDQSSHRNLWVCATTNINSSTQAVYEYAGRLDRLIYTLLIVMSFGISKLMPNTSLLSNNNHQLSLERDFLHAKTLHYRSLFSSIDGLKQFTINAQYILGTKHEIDIFFSNSHRHMLPFLYQILWWKEERCMTFPLDIRESLIKLYGLADENDTNARELMFQVMQPASDESDKEEAL